MAAQTTVSHLTAEANELAKYRLNIVLFYQIPSFISIVLYTIYLTETCQQQLISPYGDSNNTNL